MTTAERQALREAIDRRRRELVGNVDCANPSEGKYRNGCRCRACQIAAREARKARAHGKGVRTHGYVAYSRGCRCNACRESHRVYQWTRKRQVTA